MAKDPPQIATGYLGLQPVEHIFAGGDGILPERVGDCWFSSFSRLSNARTGGFRGRGMCHAVYYDRPTYILLHLIPIHMSVAES